MAPDLNTLAVLSRVSASARLKTADGKPLPKEEQLASMRTALDQAEKEMPNSPLIHQLRIALERASASDNSAGTVASPDFGPESQTKPKYNGVDLPGVESMPDEDAREQARKLLELIRGR
jgi:hypothetical protein